MSWRGSVAGIIAVTSVAMSIADPFSLFLGIGYAGVGWWLVVRRPDHNVGWLLLLVAVGFGATTPPSDLDLTALQTGTIDPVTWFRAWWSTWGGTLSFLAYIGIALTFPSGRLPDGRWRAPVIAALAVAIGSTIVVALRPTFDLAIGGGRSIDVANRLALVPGAPIWPIVDPLDDLIFVYLLAFLGCAVLSLLRRYRRSEGIARLQLRWLVAGLAAVLAAVVFGIVASTIIGGEPFGVWLPAVVAYPMVPIAIGFAITRYRLFEIDRIISRTIAYAVVISVLAIVFVGAVVGLQAALATFTQGETIAVATSTLLVFALFQPVRQRVKRAVDRRFDRARYDGQDIADAFAATVRDEIDREHLRRSLVATVSGAVRPSSAAVWIRAEVDE